MSWVNPRTTNEAPFIKSSKFEKETVQNLNYLKDSVDNIDTSAVTVQRATRTSRASMTGYIATDVTGMELSVTVTTGQKVLLMFSTAYLTFDTSYGFWTLQLLRGDTIIKKLSGWHGRVDGIGGIIAPVSNPNFFTVDVPSAGTHTYRLQMYTDSSGTTVALAADSASPMELVAITL